MIVTRQTFEQSNLTKWDYNIDILHECDVHQALHTYQEYEIA